MKVIATLFATIMIWVGCISLKPTHNVNSTNKLKALIIDGENNHGYWPKTTVMMKDYLEQTGLFEVDVNRTAFTWQGGAYDKSAGIEDIKQLLDMYPIESESKTTAVDKQQADPNFSPDFKSYDVVISNMGWGASTWPEKTRQNFEEYVKNGGGLVVIHAANNSWGDWLEYNKMIGIGGWGDRNASSGSYASYNDMDELELQVPDGNCGSHGPQHEYIMKTRAPEHPIMKGIPAEWLHTKDELYQKLCGPAENMTVLATAFSDPAKNGKSASGRGEPLLLVLEYGKGRVFHSGLGHMDYSMECVGFITTLQRGAEWAATGKVTQALPNDFPSMEETSSRKWNK